MSREKLKEKTRPKQIFFKEQFMQESKQSTESTLELKQYSSEELEKAINEMMKLLISEKKRLRSPYSIAIMQQVEYLIKEFRVILGQLDDE